MKGRIYGVSEPSRGKEAVHAEGQPLAWGLRAQIGEEGFLVEGKGMKDMGD